VSALAKLACLLGIGEHQAEDALHSERAAKAVLQRRDFLAGTHSTGQRRAGLMSDMEWAFAPELPESGRVVLACLFEGWKDRAHTERGQAKEVA